MIAEIYNCKNDCKIVCRGLHFIYQVNIIEYVAQFFEWLKNIFELKTNSKQFCQ
jgi:hypothetical protein